MSLVQRLDRVDQRILEVGPTGAPICQWAIGGTILLAGAHKLVAPGAWHRYLAPPIQAIWPATLALDPVFILFGITEVFFGVLLLWGVHLQTVALLTGLSLAGVVANLAIGIVTGAPFVDVLIRDLGLMLLAFGVAFSRPPEQPADH